MRVIALLSVLVGTSAFAGTPRTITAAEVIEPTCFGMAADGLAVYAVRMKSGCDAATSTCEAASYLTRVTPDGRGKTVGYLTLKKGDTLPDANALRASTGAGSIEKAQAAISDAVMPCDVVKQGAKLTLDGGRVVNVGVMADGRMALRSDSFREVIIPKDVEQVFWGPGAKTWYLRRTLTTETGLDASFESIDVSRLFLDVPAKPSTAAIALTHENLLTSQCLGIDADGSAYWSQSDVAHGWLDLSIQILGENGPRTFSVASREMPPALQVPSLVVGTVTAAELAFANEQLAKVKYPCTLTPMSGAALELRSNDKTVSVSYRELGGNPTAQIRFRGPDGGRRDVLSPASTPKILHHPQSPTWYVIGDSVRASIAIGMKGVLARPERYPLKAGNEPVCTTERGADKLVTVEHRPDGDVLVMVGPDAPLKELARGARGVTPEALVKLVDDDTLIDMMPSSGEVGSCTLTALGSDKGFDVEGAPYTLTHGARGWVAGRPGYELVLPQTSGDARWSLPGRRPVLVFADESGKLSFVRIDPDRFVELPDPPEVAAKSPKLIAKKTPRENPADKRCLAWNSKDRVAWVVRWMPDGQALLTEVRKEGYYQRVTLFKDGGEWSHMFDHANNYVAKADLGCVAGLEGQIAGTTFKVAPKGTKVSVEVNGKTILGPPMSRTDEYGNTLDRDIVNAFWHPDIKAVVVELAGPGDVGYAYIDLAKAIP